MLKGVAFIVVEGRGLAREFGEECGTVVLVLSPFLEESGED